MTAADAMRAAAERLRAAGVDDPAGDARRLMAHLLGRPPQHDDLVPDSPRWEVMVVARAERRPVAQITGRRAFWRHEFAVTPDVLDPRPDTETLVEVALSEPFGTVLDLGTGSGCILLSLLADRPAARGTGTDMSEAALAVARDNADRLGVADRAELRRADWLDGVEGAFDLIVSNPPYIAAAEMDALQPEVRLWEPRLALTPGGDGLAAYRAIARGAPARLAPGGRLMVEIGAGQGAAVSALWRGAGLSEVAVIRDLNGRDRVVSGRKLA